MFKLSKMRLFKDKKGILGQLDNIVQTVGFLAIFAAIMLIVLSNFRTSANNTDATNAINNATLGIANTFNQFPLFGTILGLMLIIGVVFLMIRGNKGGGVV